MLTSGGFGMRKESTMTRHTLITIGYQGQKRAYLDLTVEEAMDRCCEADGVHRREIESTVELIEFKDEFEVYDAWATDSRMSTALTGR